MPEKPRRADRALEAALEALGRALRATAAPWMVIGGIAGVARGIRRMTTDIDAVVRGDAVTVAQLLAVFKQHDVIPRIEDAARFAEVNLVMLLRHRPTGVDLDVSLAWSAFEHEALASATIAAFGRTRLPMCAPEDLLVFKAIAGRAKDIADIEALLLLYPEIDLERATRRVVELAALAEAPELAVELEALIAKHRSIGTRSKSRDARPKPPRRSRK